MKGCLKTALASTARKSVAFGDEEVYVADEWDRTPTEPAGRLTYEELLELKEIQRSLPRAQQLPDPVSGKMPSYILDQVPIGLLPLLPESTPSPATTAPSPATAAPPPWPFPPPPPKPRQPHPSTSWVPTHMQHLVPGFAFLPLLPSRSPSPTPSLTNESSRASSPSPEPPFLSLPHTTCPPRNVMILNGIEISLDDDDDDPSDVRIPHPAIPLPSPSFAGACAMSMRYPYRGKRETRPDVPSPWAG